LDALALAVLDPSRTSVELSEEELRAAALLLDGGDTDAVALEALETAGVVRNGAIVPYVASLLSVVAEPKLRIVVERYIAERVVLENVWATERLAVWGSEVRGGGTELRPVQPALLPWEIMRAVGLGPRERPVSETALRAPAATLERLEEMLAANEDRAALEALLMDGSQLDEAQRSTLVDVMFDRRSAWRASSIWTEARGERMESVSVLDGGDSGLWLTTHELQDGAETIVVLEPVLPSTVWHRIVGLVPAAPDGADALDG
jgi:hypothetical protein